MKYLAPLLLILAACSNTNKTEEPVTVSMQQVSDILIPEPEWIEQLHQIKSLPRKYYPTDAQEADDMTWDCGDSLFWEIVKLGPKAIPHLIQKVKDTTETEIIIPCSEVHLTVGALAFIAIDEITPIPYALAFETQYCLVQVGCYYDYPVGILESFNWHPQHMHDKLLDWHIDYGDELRWKQLEPEEKSVCQEAFGIEGIGVVDY